MQCAQSITMTTTSPYNGIKYQIIRKLFEDNEMVGGKDTFNASSVHLNETKCCHSQYKHLSLGFFLFSKAYTGIAFVITVIQYGCTSELSLLASFQEMPVETLNTKIIPIYIH